EVFASNRIARLVLCHHYGKRETSFILVQFRIWGILILLAVLLLLDAEDVGRALDAGEQVLTVVGVEEFAQRLDAADDQEQIVLAFESKDGVDEIVPRALLAQLDFQAVGEEGKQTLPLIFTKWIVMNSQSAAGASFFFQFLAPRIEIAS